MPGLVELSVQGENLLRDLQGRFRAGVSQTVVRRELNLLNQKLLAAVKREAPQRTGRLRKSFKPILKEGASEPVRVGIESDLDYAVIVATGSRRKNYKIGAKGQVMAMIKMERVGPLGAKGKFERIRTGPFTHPGIKANPYHRRAMKSLRADYLETMRRIGRGITSRLVSRRVTI